MLSWLLSMALLVVVMLAYQIVSGYLYGKKTKRWQRELRAKESFDFAARSGKPFPTVK
jgi:hypothetical protein